MTAAMPYPARFYALYGLRLCANLELPVPTCLEAGDLGVRYEGPAPRLSKPLPAHDQRIWLPRPDGWRLQYRNPAGDWVEFEQSADGALLTARGSSGLDVVEAILLGPALGAVLHSRGVPALHAMALVIDGRAFLIAGVSGAGKSTVGGALLQQGAALLSEDLSALSFEPEGIRVHPGYPRLHLYPDSAAALGIQGDLPRVFHPERPDDKRWLDATAMGGGFVNRPAPLGGIYLFAGRREDLRGSLIEKLPRAKASLALMEHLYGIGWLGVPPARVMAWCPRIAACVPVSRVWTPDRLDAISQIACDIAADASPEAAHINS